MKSKILLFVCLLLLLLLLPSCTERARTPRLVPEWGRANRVGVTSRSEPVGLAVTPDGERVVLAWPTIRPEDDTLGIIRLLVLNDAGKTVLTQDLPQTIPYLNRVELLNGKDNTLHLLWHAGKHGQREVWHAPLPAPESLTQPLSALDAQRITPESASVDDPRAVVLSSGKVLVLWSANRGHVSATVLGTGVVDEIQNGVLSYDVQVAPNGDVYFGWLARESTTHLTVQYALLDTAALTLASSSLVERIPLPGQASPSIADGPILGVTNDELYVSWTLRRGGVGSEKVLFTSVVTFDGHISEPQMLQTSVTFPPSMMPTDIVNDNGFAYQSLAANSDGDAYAFVRRLPAPLAHPNGEMLMAIPVRYATRTRQEYQPTLAYWQNGVFRGYQALTWTHAPSSDMAVATDASGHLYVAWSDIEDVFQHPLYLTSTAPRLNATWQRLTLEDYGTLLVDYASRTALGITLFPLIALWFFLPLIWLLIMLSRGGDIYGKRGARILAIALGLHGASKYVLTRQIFSYVPGLVYVPDVIAPILVYGIPTATLLLSVVVLLPFILRQKSLAVMRNYVLIALLDMVFSLAVYGIGYWE